MIKDFHFFLVRKLKPLLMVAFIFPLVAACASDESVNCSRLVFQPHGSGAFNNTGPACAESKVYSYDPMLFDRQATWVDSYSKNVASDDDDTKKKKKSSI